MVQTGHQHPLEFRLILGRHHREVGDGSHVADVVLTLVRRSIGTDDAGPIEHEGHRQVLDADVVDELVVGALQEGAVDGHNRPQTFTGHTCRQGDRVLFGDADIHVLLGNSFLQQIQAGSSGHGGGDAHHAAVLFAELDQGLAEHLAVTGRFRFLRRNGLTGAQIKSGLGVVADLICLGIGVTLSFLGDDMNQNGATITVGGLEGPHHFADVMAIDRPHVGEAQLFKHGTHLGNRETTHAALQAVQLGGELATHEGKMANAFLNTAGEELHRRTEPCAVQNIRQGTHRG